MSRCEELLRGASYFIHRADLLEAVRGAVPVELVHLGDGVRALTSGRRRLFCILPTAPTRWRMS